MARHRPVDVFPAPLREFREAEWPPVPGECLGIYACRGEGYGVPCVPRPGEACGDACYAMLADPWQVAQARRRDALVRYRAARVGADITTPAAAYGSNAFVFHTT